MRIAILGLTGAGATLAGHLARVGCDVTLVGTNTMQVNAIARDGLWVKGTAEPFHVPLEARSNLERVPDICVVAAATSEATSLLDQHRQLLDQVPILMLQSHEHAAEDAAAVVGRRSLLAGTVLFGANFDGLGRVNYRPTGPLVVGEPFGRTGAADVVVATLDAALTTVYTENPIGTLHTRLLLSAHHSLAALTGSSIAQTLASPTLRPHAMGLITEAAGVFAATRSVPLADLPGFPPVAPLLSLIQLGTVTSEKATRLMPEPLGLEPLYGAAPAPNDDVYGDRHSAVLDISGSIVAVATAHGLTANHHAALLTLADRSLGEDRFSTADEVTLTLHNAEHRPVPAAAPLSPDDASALFDHGPYGFRSY